MSYDRKDLTKVDHKLMGNHKLIAYVALERSFARKPSYWVELYQHTGPAELYQVAIQWSFPRKGEKVEGHSLGAKLVFKTALSNMHDRISLKLDSDWLVSHLSIADGVPTSVAKKLDKWYEKLPKRKDSIGSTTSPVKVEKQKPKTQAERFRELQRKRKAKAEW